MQWIMEQVHESEMTEDWKETMAAKKLGVREEEKKPAPKPVLQAWGAYKSDGV